MTVQHLVCCRWVNLESGGIRSIGGITLSAENRPCFQFTAVHRGEGKEREEEEEEEDFTIDIYKSSGKTNGSTFGRDLFVN